MPPTRPRVTLHTVYSVYRYRYMTYIYIYIHDICIYMQIKTANIVPTVLCLVVDWSIPRCLHHKKLGSIIQTPQFLQRFYPSSSQGIQGVLNPSQDTREWFYQFMPAISGEVGDGLARGF